VPGETGLVNVESEDAVRRLPKTTTTSRFAALAPDLLEVVAMQRCADAIGVVGGDSLAMTLR